MSKTINKHKAQVKKPAKAARYLRRVLYLTVALTLILLVLPYIIRYELIKGLREAGAETVQIADIDYNPFTAIISINQLLIKNDQTIFLRVSHIQLNVGYFPILRNRLIINNATLHDAEVLIEQDTHGAFIIAGIKIPKNNNSSNSDNKAWQAGIESLTLNNAVVRAHINKQDHLLQINNATLQKLHSWDANNKAHLAFNGTIDDARLELDINMQLFGESQDVSGRINLETLELQPLMPDLYGQLTVTGNMAIKLGHQGQLHINHDGSFILTNAKYTRPELVFSASDMTITGKNSLTLDKDKSGKEQLSVTYTGSLSVNQSSIIQPVKNIELLRFKKLQAGNIDIQSRNQITLSDIKLKQTTLFNELLPSESTPMVQSDLMTIDTITFDDLDKLELGSVIIDKLQLAIYRDKQGMLIPLGKILESKEAADLPADIIPADQPDTSQHDAAPVNKTDPVIAREADFTFKLDSLTITGESNVQIDDESVQPAYRSSVQIKRFELGSLDNSHIQQPTSLLIELLPAKFGAVKLAGDVYPFSPEYDLDLSLTAKSISMPRLTPYLRHYTGYLFRQGQLDTDSTFKSTKGALNGQINIVARNLEIAPVSTEKADLLRKQLGMPLDQALNMLRDRDNTITLSIPVTGNITNPDFSIGNVINIAITKAIKTGASSYLIYALGPYGIALALADSAINSGGYIRLSDIEYEAGKADFPDDQHDYLKRLQKITQDRPEVDLHLCAHATEHDRRVLLDTGDTQNINHDDHTDTAKDDREILKLAQQRMLNLKDILTQKYTIKPDRILLCKPFVDGDKHASPHIEITL